MVHRVRITAHCRRNAEAPHVPVIHNVSIYGVHLLIELGGIAVVVVVKGRFGLILKHTVFPPLLRLGECAIGTQQDYVKKKKFFHTMRIRVSRKGGGVS